ncbi:hypothetical protein Tco_1041234 [Tanacetum coccineum]|uniref:Uncharacterized protein n=1 Tax=Tanacetum coccineum TaxID=301880 RepID=A0ABQ5GHA1_9ASTR
MEPAFPFFSGSEVGKTLANWSRLCRKALTFDARELACCPFCGSFSRKVKAFPVLMSAPVDTAAAVNKKLPPVSATAF